MIDNNYNNFIAGGECGGGEVVYKAPYEKALP